jgi:uncharacterized protein (DUF924 family)
MNMQDPNADVEAVLDFWFSDSSRPLWFKSTPEFDAQIRARFETLWLQAQAGELDHWADSANGALALVILLDQFPLNMYRHDARRYATEARSRNIAEQAITRGWDVSLSAEQKSFLYLPFMHSESLADQERSLALFTAADLRDNLRWARHHYDIIARFGRFPHRNAAMDRTSTQAELDWLNSEEGFSG